jgi:hypothetical protein
VVFPGLDLYGGGGGLRVGSVGLLRRCLGRKLFWLLWFPLGGHVVGERRGLVVVGMGEEVVVLVSKVMLGNAKSGSRLRGRNLLWVGEGEEIPIWLSVVVIIRV